MKKLYEEVAKIHNTTPEYAQKEMAYAIEQAYAQNPNHELFNDGIPTVEAFIVYIVSNVGKKLKQ